MADFGELSRVGVEHQQAPSYQTTQNHFREVSSPGRNGSMVFDQIEKKKREYTDKYVMVDPTQPELARFRDVVGQVKTVNMSGRALVEFMDYHVNIGWYDIDPAFLKLVDKPAPKSAKPEGKKPAAKAEGKPAAPAKTPAAKAPAAAAKAGKPSVADILAAARAGKPADGGAASTGLGSPKSAAVAGKAPTEPAPTPAAAKPAAAPKPAAKVDRSKMSVADMLAAARAGGAGAAAAAKPEAAPPAAKTPAEAAPVAAEPVGVAAPSPPPAKAIEKIDKSKMSIADMIAWCREHDAK